MSKQKLINNLELIEQKIASLDLDTKEIKIFQDNLSKYEIKIPLIGNFSAGKSSIINTLLSDDILSVDISPETTIATEIKYSDSKSYLEVYDNEEQKSIQDVDFLTGINPREYAFTRLMLHNEELRKFDDIVLVDMPGLDSGLTNHNNAILKYIPSASSFLLVLDIQDGQIRQSTLQFLTELQLYKLNFAIVLNKKDKFLPENIQEVKKNIQNTLNMSNMKDVSIFVTDTNDKNGIQEIIHYLENLDRDSIFLNIFLPQRKKMIENYLGKLSVLYSNLTSSTGEIDNQIAEVERNLDKLRRNADNQRVVLKRDLKGKYKAKILNEVAVQLNNNSATLARDYLNNPNAFSDKINEFLRPILINEVKSNLDDLSLNVELNLSKDYNDFMNIAFKAKDFVGNLSKMDVMLNSFSKVGKSYKAFSTILAVATNVVAPWLEIIIIFLPDLLKMFGITGENKKLEQIEKQLKEKVFPDVLAKLDKPVEDSIMQQGESLITQIEHDFIQKTQMNQDILTDLKEKKSTDVKIIEDKRNLIVSVKEFLQLESENTLQEEEGELKSVSLDK